VPQSGTAGAAEPAASRGGALNGSPVCSPLLRAVGAGFRRGDDLIVPPFTIEARSTDRATIAFSDARSAKVAARMAAGIVRATCGTLLIGDYDPRIQPVHAKRLTGYVPYNGDFGWHPRSLGGRRDALDTPREAIDLHAALFEIPKVEARRRAYAMLEAIGWSDGVTLAVALALMRPIALLVLDRPAASTLSRLEDVVPRSVALVSTAVPAAAPVPVLTAK
jgi:hypothetical protein